MPGVSREAGRATKGGRRDPRGWGSSAVSWWWRTPHTRGHVRTHKYKFNCEDENKISGCVTVPVILQAVTTGKKAPRDHLLRVNIQDLSKHSDGKISRSI